MSPQRLRQQVAVLGVVVLVGAGGCGTAGSETPQRAAKETFQLPGSLDGLPFSAAVRAGGLLFLSGQIGFLPGTRELAPGGVQAETRQTMENIRAVLEVAGRSFDDVVKCTVFLRDMSDYAAVNEVYATFFPRDPPARSAVAGSGLAFDAAVEIECIAVA